VEERRVHTPYGAPSDRIAIAEIEGRSVAFLPRHGRDHSIPAHAVNYRANLWAFRELGVRQIIAPCSCGSLQADIHPGEFVVLDQFVDRTRGRADTFFDGPETHHIGAADPYCPRLRSLAVEAANALSIPVRPSGTMVVIQGPRFSTRAESAWFSREGWHVVGMTQYPEAILARELGLCYTGIALVTDYDVGVVGDTDRGPVSIEEVFRVFHQNVGRVKELIFRMIASLGSEPGANASLPGEQSGCECEEEARRAILG
jgi:5'-methylthioadenosine phosphorylase